MQHAIVPRKYPSISELKFYPTLVYASKLKCRNINNVVQNYALFSRAVVQKLFLCVTQFVVENFPWPISTAIFNILRSVCDLRKKSKRTRERNFLRILKRFPKQNEHRIFLQSAGFASNSGKRKVIAKIQLPNSSVAHRLKTTPLGQ